MSVEHPRSFFLPTQPHAPQMRFAAADAVTPRAAGGAGGLCARLRARRESGAPTHPIAVPLGKGGAEIPLARR